MRALFLALGIVAAPAMAETPMGAEAFERYTTGRTLTFSSRGVPYGIEQYLPDRRVIWSFIGQECRRGSWYAMDDQICFTYEHDPTPQCWTFYAGSDGLRARFEDGRPEPTELVEVEQSPEPLRCAGPDVGV